MIKSASSFFRYMLPILAVIAAYLVRITLERIVGPGLPTYVTFYPVIMFVAIISGLWTGLIATVTAAVTAYFFLITPKGAFGITSAAEAIGLAIFISMGIFMSVVASYYLKLRNRLHEMVAERTASLSLVNTALTRECDQRRQVEKELRLNEERFRAMFEHHQAIMLLIDPESGAIVDANVSAAAFYGFSHAELTTMRIQDINQLAEEQVASERGLAVADKKSHFIFPHRLADGKIRWVEVYSSPITIRGSRLLFSIIHDITERKRLDTERQKFVSLAENSSEFIGMCDMNLVPFYLNKTGLQQVGLETMDQALLMNVSDFFFPEDRQFIREEFLPRVMAGGQGEVEIRFRHFRTGEPVWMLCNVFHIRDAEGTPIGLATVSRNVTERKRSEERLSLLAETAGSLLATVSPQAEIEALCHKALIILDCHIFFNYLADAASGRLYLNASAGIPEEEKQKIAWLDSGVAIGGSAARDACRLVAEEIPDRPDERTATSFGAKAYACQPLVIAGEILGTLSFGSHTRTSFSEDDLELMKAIADLAAIAIERKRDRQKLENAHATLEQQVMERTADLQEALRSLESEMNERLQAVEELRQNERLLSQQSRLAAMGEMISNIAHQWRQPLNTLGLLVQRLPIFYDSDVFNQGFLVNTTDDAMKLIQHMSATIDDFRDFFRPEKEQTLFSIDRAINQAIALVDVSFRNQNLCVELHTEGNPVVIGFPNEFSQVIMNILLNSRDALLDRGVEPGIIRIRAGCENDRVHVTISDNAGGIPETIIDRIFDPYFTTKGPDRGTGIGLFMAKSIIEQNHGGRLSARNIQDGAEFRIEI